MRLARLCVPSGTHFLILASLVTCLLWSTVSAHTVVLSEYSLKYENEQWMLYFNQKTSQLRDAIYASNPELKGINLNSEVFKEATSNLIAANLTLTYRGDQLRFVPQHMHYGGLRFESRFVIEGLRKDPDYLTMSVAGFDTHEHSVVLVRIGLDSDAYLQYFNQDQRLATFDFANHSYVFEVIESTNKNKIILYVFLILGIIAVAGAVIRRRNS